MAGNAEREVLTLAHWGAYWVRVVDDRIVGVRPFEFDPAPPPQLADLPAMLESPLRIRRPAVRASYLRGREKADRTNRGREPFVEVGWDEALDLVAAELVRVRSERGSTAILGGSYGWSSAGRFHHARTQLRRFLFTSGGCTDGVGNYSWGAAQYLLPRIVGSHGPVSGANTSLATVAKHTDLVVAFGGLNPKNWLVTAGGTGEHATEGWWRRVGERGTRFVNVSPAAGDMPDGIEALWLAIRPGTDTALMLALAHVLVSENLHDQAFLHRCCAGFPVLNDYLFGRHDGTPKTPAWAASITGIEPASIVALARRMAAGRSFLTASWSLQRAEHGEQPYWMLIALAALLGQIGRPGGGYGFGQGSLNGVGFPIVGLPAPSLPTGPNPAGAAVPVARLADLLLEPGREIAFDGGTLTLPDIRLVHWAGGNPFHHHQNLPRLERAWAKPETVIVQDPFWTPTARRADIVLPATTSLEREDIGGSSRDRFLFAMHRAVTPRFAARDDHEILKDVAARLGSETAFTEGLAPRAWIERLYETVRQASVTNDLPPFASFWERAWLAVTPSHPDFVLHEAFAHNPEAAGLATASGLIELATAAIPGRPPHPAWIEPREWLGSPLARSYPIHLLTPQPADKLHGQLDPGPSSRAAKRGGRTVLTLNDRDAAARGIKAGDLVRVWNDRGACLASAEPSAGLRPGVAMLPTGAWYDPLETDGGTLDRHGNPNVLTQDVATSPLGQACAAQSCLVEIERFTGDPPAITIFNPPPIATSAP